MWIPLTIQLLVRLLGWGIGENLLHGTSSYTCIHRLWMSLAFEHSIEPSVSIETLPLYILGNGVIYSLLEKQEKANKASTAQSVDCMGKGAWDRFVKR